MLSDIFVTVSAIDPVLMFTVIYIMVFGKFTVGDIYHRKQVERANWILPVNLLWFNCLWKDRTKL